MPLLPWRNPALGTGTAVPPLTEGTDLVIGLVSGQFEGLMGHLGGNAPQVTTARLEL